MRVRTTLIISILSSGLSLLSFDPGLMQCNMLGANTVAKLLESILLPGKISPENYIKI